MPLASTFALQWYGPAMGAAVIGGQGATDATAKAVGRAGAVVAGAGSVARARVSRMVSASASIAGAASVTRAVAKVWGRAGAVVGSTGLSQSDVTGAVLEALVEPGMTLKQALRLILAASAGKVDASGATVTIRNPADTKTRITATVANGERTAVSYDLSDG